MRAEKTEPCGCLLEAHAIVHIVTPPYTPQWTRKVERLHQTMERESAEGVRCRRTTLTPIRGLPAGSSWLRNPFCLFGIKGNPPTNRAHNLPGRTDDACVGVSTRQSLCREGAFGNCVVVVDVSTWGNVRSGGSGWPWWRWT